MAEFPEAVRMSAAASSARPKSRPVMATRAPNVASPIAVALPIPPVPPVIRTTLPAIGLETLWSDSDDDLAAGVALFEIANRGRGFPQPIRPVADRLDIPRLGVVDDVVGPDGPDHLDVPCAAYPRHLRTERLCDLHGESPDTARRTDDEHRLAGLDVCLVPKPLQRGRRRQGNGRGLLEREV